MAFTVAQYLNNNFKVANSADAIREAAEAILSGHDVIRLIGNVSPEKWAQKALSALDSGDIAKAYDWITGTSDPKGLARVKQKYASAKADYNKKVQSIFENYANVTDFSNPNLTTEQKTKAQSQADAYLADNQDWIGQAQSIGVSVEPILARTKSGFVAVSEGERKRKYGRLGEPVKSVQQADGTYSVIGQNSGKTFSSGLSLQEADKYSNMEQSQGTADATGAFSTSPSTATSTTTSGSTGSYQSTILPSDINTNGLTTEQIRSLEQAYLDASGDTSLASKLTITDADIQGFIDKAASESDPYYNQIYTRAQEDYARGLEYKAQVRQDEIAQEQLNAAIAMEQSQGQNAESGLAFSGIRNKAEARLKDQADNVARANRRTFNEDVMQFGRTTEDLIGSSKTANVAIPTVDGASIYTPGSGITGSVEREQLTANSTRASELEEEQRLRNLAALPEATVATEELASLM